MCFSVLNQHFVLKRLYSKFFLFLGGFSIELQLSILVLSLVKVVWDSFGFTGGVGLAGVSFLKYTSYMLVS